MRPERTTGKPAAFAPDAAEQPNGADCRGAARMIEFPRSLFVEPAADTVGGDGLDELLEVLAEIGLEAAAERDRRKGELHFVAS